MNKTVRDILLFAAGFGAGALVMHTVFEKKYETYYGKRYEAERENLRQKEADMDKTIEERATQKSFEQLAGKYRTGTLRQPAGSYEILGVRFLGSARLHNFLAVMPATYIPIM